MESSCTTYPCKFLWLALVSFIVAVLCSLCFQPFSNPIASLDGTGIQKAFEVPQCILLAETAAISVNAPMFVDLILDLFSSKNIQDKIIDDRFERLVLTLILIVPGIVTVNGQSYPNFPFLCCCMYTIQIVGSCVASFSLLVRLVPEHFTPTKILISFVNWAFGTTLVLYVFVNPPSKIWPDTLIVITFALSQGLLLQMSYNWAKSLYRRAEAAPATGINALKKIVKEMTDEEFSLVLYLFFVELFSFQIHSLVGAVSTINWVNVDRAEFLFGIYNLAAFSILTGVVPNRIIQKLAKTQEKQLDTNHTIVRYISHEIRSPLNIVQNGVRLVLDELQGQCPPAVTEMLCNIQQAGYAASSIVDDLLNFEQIKTGAFRMKKVTLPASLCLAQIAKRCCVLAREKQIHFSIQNTLHACEFGRLYTIYVDSMRLEQAIQSLVANSIIFTPQKGSIIITINKTGQNSIENPSSTEPTLQRSILLKHGSGPISNTLTRKVHCVDAAEKRKDGILRSELKHTKVGKLAGTVSIAIKDNGIGINKEQLDEVFVRLEQFDAHALRGRGGNGLGLWICKEIIRQHGGEISISSDGEGCGTVIEIKLDCFLNEGEPIIEHVVDVHNNKLFQNSQSPISISRHSSNITDRKVQFIDVRPNAYSIKSSGSRERSFQILIVDDISLNRKILAKMLTKMESEFQQQFSQSVYFNCEEADDGVTALEQLQQCTKNFDIVFLDNVMLKVNGPKTAQIMREEHLFSGKIIGVTGNALEVDVSDFLLHGADQVLIKPVSYELLSKLVLDLLLCEKNP